MSKAKELLELVESSLPGWDDAKKRIQTSKNRTAGSKKAAATRKSDVGMSKAEYSKMIKKLHSVKKDYEHDFPGGRWEDAASDTARELMSHGHDDHSADAIKKHLKSRGVTDIKGRLTDDIYDGKA